jgi:perosamine synthetase
MLIPQSKPDIRLEDYEAMRPCFSDNWITEGKRADEFITRLNYHAGVNYGVLAPNGTLALYLALSACGIGVGDEVIVPNTTFIASATAIHMTGATPVFVDVDEYLQIDISRIEAEITQRTKAVMVVHLFGSVADVTGVRDIIGDRDIKIVEDACQALTVQSRSKKCGSLGDIAAFSFFADKTITTGEGGYVCTNDLDLYKKLKFLRNQGRENRGSFIHPEIGYNFRMTDFQAALGLNQLDRIDEIKQSKSSIAEKYLECLPSGIELLPISPNTRSYTPFRVVIRSETKGAEEVMHILRQSGVEPRSCFYPLHKQPCWGREFDDSKFPNSIDAYENYVCLPTYTTLTDLEIAYVCKVLIDAV